REIYASLCVCADESVARRTRVTGLVPSNTPIPKTSAAARTKIATVTDANVVTPRRCFPPPRLLLFRPAADYSITASASSRSDSGIDKPSALAGLEVDPQHHANPSGA